MTSSSIAPPYLCIVCDNPYWQSLYWKNSFHYFRCSKCKLEVTHPLPTPVQIDAYYKSKADKDFYAVRVHYPRQDNVHEKIAKWAVAINDGKVPQTVLDVGCLDGTLLDVFKKMGATTYGVELQKDAADSANKKHDNQVFNGTIEEFLAKHDGQRFDMVTAIGVVEHVLDPAAFLAAIRRVIKSDGLLILQTPNTGSLLHHLMKSNWPPYVPIEHIYLFSDKNLAILLDNSGFEMTVFKRHWKSLQIEFFYLMTEIFMPFAYKLLRPIVPHLPEAIRKMRMIPLYSGEMLVAANPVSGYKRTIDRGGKFWLYD